MNNNECQFQLTNGKKVSLDNYLGKWLILYFYPKDSTPGCTLEGQHFRDKYAEFSKLNAEILGVSRDGLASHQRFKDNQRFPFELLSDADEKLCQQFDVIKMKSMYGKQVRGIERSTFIIGPSGEVKREWRKVKVEGHVDEVLSALKDLVLEG